MEQKNVFCDSCSLLVKGISFKINIKGTPYYSCNKLTKRIKERKTLNNGKEVIAIYYKKKVLDTVDNKAVKASNCPY